MTFAIEKKKNYTSNKIIIFFSKNSLQLIRTNLQLKNELQYYDPSLIQLAEKSSSAIAVKVVNKWNGPHV